MVMDTLALAVSASANYFLRHKEAQRMMLPLVAFPICGLLDLFCIYHELKSVQLRSLNRERAEMVAQHWLEQGKVRALQTCQPALQQRPTSCPNPFDAACLLNCPQSANHANASRWHEAGGPAASLHQSSTRRRARCSDMWAARARTDPFSATVATVCPVQIPTFKDISSEEQLMGPPNISGNLLPLRLLPLEQTVSSPSQLQRLLSSYKGSKYMLAVQPGEHIPWWDWRERFMAGYKAAPHIAVALASDAKPKDILTAVLEAAYLRRRLREQQQQVLVQLQQQQRRQPCTCSSSSSSCGCGSSSMTPQRQDQQQQRQVSSNGGICSKCGGSVGSSEGSSIPLLPIDPLQLDVSNAESSNSSMRRDAKRLAEKRVGRFMYEMQADGWQTKPFLLCSSEKSGFVKY